MEIHESHNNISLIRFCYEAIFFSAVMLVLCAFTVFFPFQKQPEQLAEADSQQNVAATGEDAGMTPEQFGSAVSLLAQKEDMGLTLYRSLESRAAVVWFYTHITKDTDVTTSILHYADKNNIPLSLAFAVAHTESRYKTNAVNKNATTTDRGLFQLNDSSFPRLTEDDFFNPDTSAKYGLAFLRYCIDSAGNEVGGLAMYNAGPGRVRSNSTPKRTLDYVSIIMDYRNGLDELFTSQIAIYYTDRENSFLAQLPGKESPHLQ